MVELKVKDFTVHTFHSNEISEAKVSFARIKNHHILVIFQIPICFMETAQPVSVYTAFRRLVRCVCDLLHGVSWVPGQRQSQQVDPWAEDSGSPKRLRNTRDQHKINQLLSSKRVTLTLMVWTTDRTASSRETTFLSTPFTSTLATLSEWNV